jgi:RNA polymerase sigma-70 factor, ECF subfamily
VLVRHYQRAVIGFCVNMLRGSVEHVEDIAQEVFLAVWKTLPQFRHESTIRTWVFAITRHHRSDVLQQRGHHDVFEAPDTGTTRETPDTVPPVEEHYAYHNLLA